MDKLKELVGNIAVAVYLVVNKIPQRYRLLLRDMLEAAGAAIASVQFIMPQNVDDARRLGITVSFAIGAAVIAVVRRYIWGLILDKIASRDS